MSYLPPSPAWPPPQQMQPPPHEQQQPPPRRHRPGKVIGLSVLLVGLLVVGGLVFTRLRHQGGVPHPDQWDERVLDLVKFDERHRGLDFDHPVYIDFLTAEQYSDRVRSQFDAMSDEDKKELDSGVGQLRALGLASGDFDLLQANEDLADAGTAAFYDPDTKRVSVRGIDMTVEVRATLVHELTHALQDQHFDIGTARNDAFATSGERSAFRALVEGDANRIEDEYISSLTEAEQSEYYDSNHASFQASQDKLTDVPDALQALMAAPYIYGPSFVQVLDSDGGQSEIDSAFRHPPAHDEQQIDPRQFLHDHKPLEVDKPALPDGVADEVDSGDFGAAAWYLMLAEKIPFDDALKAVDGWGGDAYVTYELQGKTCIRMAWNGDSPADFDEMHQALDTWAAAMPQGVATVRADGDQLRVESCDPGKDADVAVAGNSMDALTLIQARSELIWAAMEQGDLDVDESFDFAQCVVDALPADELVKIYTSPDEPPSEYFDALDSCSAG